MDVGVGVTLGGVIIDPELTEAGRDSGRLVDTLSIAIRFSADVEDALESLLFSVRAVNDLYQYQKI